MIIAFLLILLLLALGAIVYLLGQLKFKEKRKVSQLQSEINRLLPVALARDFARLGLYQRRLGVVYIDSLPLSSEKVKKAYETGLKFAEQGMWDKAYQCWNEGKGQAQGNELGALYFLCGGCLTITGQFGDAERELNMGLKILKRSESDTGIAATRFLLARLAIEQRRFPEARKLLKQIINAGNQIGNIELQGQTLVRLAELSLADRLYEMAIDYYRQALKFFEAGKNFNFASGLYRNIGDIYFKLGKLDNARAAYEDGLHMARASRSREAEADSLTAIGIVHRVQGDYKRAVDVLDRALRIYRDGNLLKGQAQVLYELARVHEKGNELDIARELFEQGLVLARKVGDTKLIINNLLGLVVNAIFHYSYERAKELISEASSMGKQLSCPDLTVRIHTVAGRLHIRQGELEKAVSILNEAISLAQEIDDHRHKAKALLELTRALRLAGKIKEAEKAIKHFWQIFKEVRDEELEGEAWREEGLIRAEKDEINVAQELLRKAYDRHSILGVGRAMAEDLLHIGKIFFRYRQYAEAKASLQNAVNMAEAAGDAGIQAKALEVLGDVLRSLNESDGVDIFTRAINLYRIINDPRGEADTLKKLGMIFLENGVRDRARVILEQALRVYQRLNDPDNVEMVKTVINKIPTSAIGLKFTTEI